MPIELDKVTGEDVAVMNLRVKVEEIRTFKKEDGSAKRVASLVFVGGSFKCDLKLGFTAVEGVWVDARFEMRFDKELLKIREDFKLKTKEYRSIDGFTPMMMVSAVVVK